MAFDLTVGTGWRAKDQPSIVGAIEFDELWQISALLKRVDSFFLHRISNLFDDQQFSIDEVTQALGDLLPLLTQPMPEQERAMLNRLIAVLAFAQNRQQSLFGLAD